ncbi:E3 ubiquitin-protein ligase ATL4-like [Dendrobium catenatum]|uniref:E3 ubiquitin-protein ligase ATL4 n=1 Tax=Dendrobium catenatum TaxID=906689 RepID=A0A2I0VTV8_9ASPA|nr:E3 ubiquitin-protein ligase ATL4-like [Dendrobium catenatum]PKU66851.1 E3 ubiquitin-protein ligase ATL4 [Dendrobium catenatum]
MIPKPVITFLYLLDLIQYTFSFLLYLISLNPSFVTEPTPWESEELLFLSLDISMDSTAESLKEKLPVIEYKSFVKKKGKNPTTECAICLQFMEAKDHVHELGNCCHAFHVDCMDRWLDLGRLSCPLCRTAVVPAEARRSGPLSVLKVLLVGDSYCNSP